MVLIRLFCAVLATCESLCDTSPFPYYYYCRVFSYYGKLANVTALEIMVLDPYRRMQPKKAVAEPLEQSDRKEERRVSESSMKDLPAPDKREESPEEELRGEESKTSSHVAEAKASPRSESVADTTTAAEKKSADRVSPRPTSNLTQPIPSPRNHSQNVDERSLAPSSPRGVWIVSPSISDYFHSSYLLLVVCMYGLCVSQWKCSDRP